MSSHNFHAIWPVDPSGNYLLLIHEALEDLGRMAFEHGVILLGQPQFSRTQPDVLAATAPAMRDPFPGREPPWESIDAYREDLIDPLAA